MGEHFIKVCGMRDKVNIRKVAELGIDWMGFIFYPKSPRYVGNADVGEKAEGIKRVGVFVDAAVDEIIKRIRQYSLDIIQLHGSETAAYIEGLRDTLNSDGLENIKLMKALSIASADDVGRYKEYEGHADYFLFDTKTPLKGGSGRKFDWSVLDNYDGITPFLLSGGIGPDDAERVRAFRHPRCIGIDLNSKFETAPAVKDVGKLRAFIDTLSKP